MRVNISEGFFVDIFMSCIHYLSFYLTDCFLQLCIIIIIAINNIVCVAIIVVVSSRNQSSTRSSPPVNIVCFISPIDLLSHAMSVCLFLSLHFSGIFSVSFSPSTSTSIYPPQWGAADAEIKVPSYENTELERSPFKAWSRSVCSHTCYAYCQGFLPGLFLPFQSIHLHFFQNLSQFFLCWLWLTHGSSVGPLNKIGHPARGRFPC